MKSSLITDEETEARPQLQRLWEHANNPSLSRECKSAFPRGQLPVILRRKWDEGKNRRISYF